MIMFACYAYPTSASLTTLINLLYTNFAVKFVADPTPQSSLVTRQASVDSRPTRQQLTRDPQSLNDFTIRRTVIDETNDSDCELMSETEVATSRKQNRAKAKKASKPPLAPTDVPASSVNKSRKRSPWWSHYVVDEEVPDVAECKYCHAMIGSASNDDGSIETMSIPRLWEFNQDVIRKALSYMLIVDELPFSFVEREGFRKFCKVINPHFLIPSRLTTTRDCYSFFIEERKKLLSIFKKLPSRVCLTTDTWTSGQNLCYMCLTAHFIDDDWTLHKRIINFCPIVGHSGVLIGRAIEKCLVEWGLKNIMTITVDNASSNDVAVNHLRNVLNHWECGVLKGAFLHMRCAAHILNLVVKDGLMDVNLSVKKIRTIVKYVRSSPARLLKFKSSVEEEKIESKSLVCMDVDTRWNSTFFMLESAVKFKKAFSNLLLKDSNFAKEVKKCEGGVITDEDWVNVNCLLPFFWNRMHADKSIKNMALKMQTKYKKYWGDVAKLNQFMFLGVVLDPRRKWQYIAWVVQKIFGEISATSFLANLESNIRVLFDSYSSSLPQNETEEEVSSSTPSDSHNSTWGDEVEMDIEQLMTKHFEMDMGSCEGNLYKTELDKYLGEDREAMDVNFDILKWWGLISMAQDVLAIPVSMVASESAFSTGGRVLDSFRTSLTPRMVEALVCTQDWVRDCHDPINVDDILLEIEKLEEECLKDLTVDQPTIIIDETVDELADNIRVGILNFRIYMLLSEYESEISDIRKSGYPKFRIRIRIVIYSFRNFGYPEIRISEFSDIRI
ncbi:hypothetical protein LXL04_030198 [Taraxacum kok-saghyz]